MKYLFVGLVSLSCLLAAASKPLTNGSSLLLWSNMLVSTRILVSGCFDAVDKCLLSLVLNSPTPDSTNTNHDSLSHRLEAAIARFAPSDSVEYSAQRI